MASSTEAAIKLASGISANALRHMQDETYKVDQGLAGVAMLHTRQDVAAIFSMQASIHRELVNLSRGVWILVFVVVSLALQHFFHW